MNVVTITKSNNYATFSLILKFSKLIYAAHKS